MNAISRTRDFPPYELLDGWELRAADKTHRLERLYHQTQARSWDPRAMLDELEKRHGGIHVPEDKREALGHVFTVILWGELAAWNIAADLARAAPRRGRQDGRDGPGVRRGAPLHGAPRLLRARAADAAAR